MSWSRLWLTVYGLSVALPTLTVLPSLEAFLLFNASKAQSFPHTASDPFNHTGNGTNAINAISASCFSQPPDPSTQQLRTIFLDDCLRAIFEILYSPIALIPKVWDPRFREFPVWNVFGTCAIGILPRWQTSHDVFPELLVAHVAAIVINMCVKSKAEEKVGGIAVIGASKEFEICVYGRDPGGVGIGDLGHFGVNTTALS